MKWTQFFPETELQYAATFDGRAVCYPSESILRDYLSWRQVDCHINNQYNTCFWKLVESGMSTTEAQDTLKGTTADVKNNLLFEKFNINYNNLPQIFRKGSIVYRKQVEEVGKKENGEVIKRLRMRIVVEHEDIIRDGFWIAHPYILTVARSKQRQAHPPSPAAKPQLSSFLR
jgi:tRNA(His) guanylyltransferase